MFQKFVVTKDDDDNIIKVCQKGSNITCIITPKLKFLDIMRYVAAGVSYDKLLKAYQCKQTKSWFPYEWFDNVDKLDYPDLPDYSKWYSKLKGKYLLTEEEFELCKKIFHEKGMTKFGDWLEYYNNLDVAPGIEAIKKMKDFYYSRGIDMFKDVVSLSGIGYQYMMRGTKEELYAPSYTAYELLKKATCGGPSIVFCRYHEAGITKIRSHKNEIKM